MVAAGIDIGYSNLKVVTGNFSTGPRVMIRPGGACPLENVAQELHAELARISSRQRAERLRHLAALGLALVRNPELVLKGGQSTETHPATVERPSLPDDAAQRQDALKSRLTAGLGSALCE